jgi:ferredoxin
LGLVIVKQVVVEAGGEIWVDSELGHGSTFTFALPAASAQAEKAPSAVVEHERGGRMTLRIIEKRAMAEFVSSLMQGYEVVGPRAKDGQYAFGPITEYGQLRLDYNTTVLPPKKYLLPQEETLFTFKTEGLAAAPVFDTQPRVVLGVHTCDLHAISLLDAVFTTGERDEHYLKRRASTLLVGLECLTPCDEHSFCKSMNTLSVSEGFDLHLTDLGDRYAVEIGTPAGEGLLAKFGGARPAGQQDAAMLNRVLSEKWPRFPYRLDFDGAELPALMAVSYKSPTWAELEKTCLACGSCNTVCPTCYCFNVLDDISLDGKTGTRRRVWDSCQLDEFARVAGGENFRKSRAQRQRHRFFRKGKYIPDMHGELGCVGCGRCARACLVDITPVGVWNALHKAHVG